MRIGRFSRSTPQHRNLATLARLRCEQSEPETQCERARNPSRRWNVVPTARYVRDRFFEALARIVTVPALSGVAGVRMKAFR
jgi:hypothetical protein